MVKWKHMAYSDNSTLLRKLRGMLNKELVFRDWAGKTVVSRAPGRRKKKSTPDQSETRLNFKFASRYANAITKSADRSLADAYALLLKPRQNVYSRALEDFMKIPDIKFIHTDLYFGAVGDKITVRAVDDFRVLGVIVEITSVDGTLLESGHAVQNVNGIDWTYIVTKFNTPFEGTKIKAIATDVPGNEGILEVKI
jgi:hypothetical protein